MRQTTTAKVRLEAGKCERFSASAQSTDWFDSCCARRARFAVARAGRRCDPWPHNHAESGECRPFGSWPWVAQDPGIDYRPAWPVCWRLVDRSNQGWRPIPMRSHRRPRQNHGRRKKRREFPAGRPRWTRFRRGRLRLLLQFSRDTSTTCRI